MACTWQTVPKVAVYIAETRRGVTEIVPLSALKVPDAYQHIHTTKRMNIIHFYLVSIFGMMFLMSLKMEPNRNGETMRFVVSEPPRA